MMRNIEDLANEEEARIRILRNEWLAKVSVWLLILSLAVGWLLFGRGDVPVGSLVIVLSLTGLLLRSGIHTLFQIKSVCIILSLVVGFTAFVLYNATAAPSFLWGHDPGFWLSALEGRVLEPAWTPLVYLLIHALKTFIPVERLLSYLPVLSAGVASAAVTVACSFLVFAPAPDRTWKTSHWLSGILPGLFLVSSRPFWIAATQASGLPASLGLILFHAYQASRRPSLRAFLLGLMFSVHPLWGFMGLVFFIPNGLMNRLKLLDTWAWFLAGLTPYLWVLLRADRSFPSWGGADPFGEVVRNGMELLCLHFTTNWNLRRSLEAWGGGTAWLAAFTLLRILLSPRGKIPIELRLPTVPIFIACILGSMFYSDSLGCLSVVSLWIPAVLASAWAPRGDPHTGKRLVFPSATPGFFHWKTVVLAAAVGLVLFPSQRVERQNLDLPRRHALNILVGVDERTAVVFEDPFEEDACRFLQCLEGIVPDALFLDRHALNRRWYLSGLIRYHPEWLFTDGNGTVDIVFQDMVANNLADWDVCWAVSELPVQWDSTLMAAGWKAYPRVLTQRFVVAGPKEPPFDDISSRFDLAGFLGFSPAWPPVFEEYRNRYTQGFYDLGGRMERLGNYALAIRSYERAVKLDPSYEAPQEALTRLFTEKRVLEAARMDYEKTLKGHPAKIQFWMQKAGQYGKNGKDPHILETLDEVIRLNVELSDAQLNLGRIYEREGKTREARSLLESASRLAPQRVEVQMELGYQMLRVGNRVKAVEAFRAVLAIDPQNKDAQRQLWKLLSRP